MTYSEIHDSKSNAEDPVAAHTWRAQTVHYFTRYNLKNDPNASTERSHRREAWYNYLTRWFEDSEAQLLLRQVSAEARRQRYEELYSIFRDAGELFAGLWTQKVWIKTWDIEDLKDKRYSSRSKDMELDVSYGLSDANDSFLNGRRVQAVIQPAIVAYGNENGTNYDRHKVWSKAVVWVGPAVNPSGRPR